MWSQYSKIITCRRFDCGEYRLWMDTITVSKNLKETSEFVFHYRSPHGGIKVMSSGSLLEESDTAYVKLNYN